MTKAGVIDFQDNHPVYGGSDGIVGPKTLAVMFAVSDPDNGNQGSDPDIKIKLYIL